MVAAKPEFPDETPIQPFHMWNGANYKLKIRQVDQQTNYDSSEFEKMSQFLPTDEEMSAVYDQEYTLKELNDKDKFKEFPELEKRFNRVEGGEKSTAKAAEPEKEKEAVVSESTKDENGFDEDDEAMNYFQNLAEE